MWEIHISSSHCLQKLEWHRSSIVTSNTSNASGSPFHPPTPRVSRPSIHLGLCLHSPVCSGPHTHTPHATPPVARLSSASHGGHGCGRSMHGLIHAMDAACASCSRAQNAEYACALRCADRRPTSCSTPSPTYDGVDWRQELSPAPWPRGQSSRRSAERRTAHAHDRRSAVSPQVSSRARRQGPVAPLLDLQVECARPRTRARSTQRNGREDLTCANGSAAIWMMAPFTSVCVRTCIHGQLQARPCQSVLHPRCASREVWAPTTPSPRKPFSGKTKARGNSAALCVWICACGDAGLSVGYVGCVRSRPIRQG